MAGSLWLASVVVREAVILFSPPERKEGKNMSDRMKSSLPDDTGLEPQNDLFRPFPRDVFPAPLARFVEAQAASLNCDEANVALPVLSALASAIGATRRIRIKRNWIEPAVLCAELLAGSRFARHWRKIHRHSAFSQAWPYRTSGRIDHLESRFHASRQRDH